MPAGARSARVNKTNLLMRVALIAIIVGMIGGGVGYLVGQRTGDENKTDSPSSPGQSVGELRQAIHEHADFAVFVNGTALAFDEPRFLSTEGDDKSLNVHLHSPRTNVAHLHREQTTYDEFFLSLGMELTDTCLRVATGEAYCNNDSRSLKFFVNGVRVDSLQFERISDLSRTLISYGPVDAQLDSEIAIVSDEACIPGENCASRVPPGGIEVEPCAKSAGECH